MTFNDLFKTHVGRLAATSRIESSVRVWLDGIADKHRREAQSRALARVDQATDPIRFTARAIIRYVAPTQQSKVELLDMPIVDILAYCNSPRQPGGTTAAPSLAEVRSLRNAWDFYRRTVLEESRDFFRQGRHTDGSGFDANFFGMATLFNMFSALDWGTFVTTVMDEQLELFQYMRDELRPDGGGQSMEVSRERAGKRRKLDEDAAQAEAERAKAESLARGEHVVLADELTQLAIDFRKHWEAQSPVIEKLQLVRRKEAIARSFDSVMQKHTGLLTQLTRQMRGDPGYLVGGVDPNGAAVRRAKLVKLNELIDYVVDTTARPGELKAYVAACRARVATRVPFLPPTLSPGDPHATYVRTLQACAQMRYRREWYDRFFGAIGLLIGDIARLFEVPTGFDARFTEMVSKTRQIAVAFLWSDYCVIEDERREVQKDARSPRMIADVDTRDQCHLDLLSVAIGHDVDDFMEGMYAKCGDGWRGTQDVLAELRAVHADLVASKPDPDPDADRAVRSFVAFGHTAIGALELGRTALGTLTSRVQQVEQYLQASATMWREEVVHLQSVRATCVNSEETFSRLHRRSEVLQREVSLEQLTQLRAGIRDTGYVAILQRCVEHLVKLELDRSGGVNVSEYRTRVNAITRVTDSGASSMPMSAAVEGLEQLLRMTRLNEAQEQCAIAPYQPKGIVLARPESV